MVARAPAQPDFAAALTAATEHVYRSLERPIEGTIITVMREVAEEASRARTRDFADLLELMLERARAACDRTPELLPVLRRAGVVDAGALGFVHILEGVGAYVHGDPFTALPQPLAFDDVPTAAAAAEYPTANEVYRYCTEALVRGAALPDQAAVREWLRQHGDSIIVIRSGDVLKVHVHTDDPETIFAHLRSAGTLVTHKAEDMAAQHAAVERAGGGSRAAGAPADQHRDGQCVRPAGGGRPGPRHPRRAAARDLRANEALRDRIDITAVSLRGAAPRGRTPDHIPAAAEGVPRCLRAPLRTAKRCWP
jgi:uncharacterized protein